MDEVHLSLHIFFNDIAFFCPHKRLTTVYINEIRGGGAYALPLFFLQIDAIYDLVYNVIKFIKERYFSCSGIDS